MIVNLTSSSAPLVASLDHAVCRVIQVRDAPPIIPPCVFDSIYHQQAGISKQIFIEIYRCHRQSTYQTVMNLLPLEITLLMLGMSRMMKLKQHKHLHQIRTVPTNPCLSSISGVKNIIHEKWTPLHLVVCGIQTTTCYLCFNIFFKYFVDVLNLDRNISLYG